MDLINHTSFPAQDFGGIDQHDQAFYVIALRQTLQWDENSALSYAETQLPLCESDAFWTEGTIRSPRYESDYCHYKPKCDVIVNATAYAPSGVAAPSFFARLQVRGPDRILAPPPRPTGLNQFMAPSSEALAEWHKELKTCPVPGPVLIDKTLEVTGARYFKRRNWWARMVAVATKFSTLGVWRPSVWYLSKPEQILSLPIRAEYAFGGECRIDAADPAASRVRTANRLTPEQTQELASIDESLNRCTVASVCFEGNPFGRGFAKHWFLSATGTRQVSAPQISLASRPATAHDFVACLDGEASDDFNAGFSIGFGTRPKCDPRRRVLAGTLDNTFASSTSWLPQDFDFSVWNAAEPDQQVDFLKGGEVIELTNLCAPNAPGAQQNAAGDTLLKLILPKNECLALVRLESGEIFSVPMVIDTVVVEPEERKLSLVWRLILARTDEVPIRVVEVMSRSHAERDSVREKVAAIKQTAQDDNMESAHG